MDSGSHPLTALPARPAVLLDLVWSLSSLQVVCALHLGHKVMLHRQPGQAFEWLAESRKSGHSREAAPCRCTKLGLTRQRHSSHRRNTIAWRCCRTRDRGSHSMAWLSCPGLMCVLDGVLLVRMQAERSCRKATTRLVHDITAHLSQRQLKGAAGTSSASALSRPWRPSTVRASVSQPQGKLSRLCAGLLHAGSF